jgi:hypothetical protein
VQQIRARRWAWLGVPLALAVGSASALAFTQQYAISFNGSTAGYNPITISAPDDAGYGTFPGAPPCPTGGLTAGPVTLSGIGANERVTGQIFASYLVPGPNGNTSVPIPGASVSVDQTGGGYSTSLQLPASNQWLSSELHVDVQLSVQDANTGVYLDSSPTIGSGADWDVFSSGCFKTPSVGKGATATIGFWHNKNGQALITSFNGGPTSTALSGWLSKTFPNLYGCLKGETNADIAALVMSDFGVKGAKVDAQVLATALAVYATDSDLGGGTMAAKYGFTVNTTGTGARPFNVGADGEAVGVPDNTTPTILQILKGADAESAGCVLDGKDLSLLGATNSLFSAINQGGDIG